MGLARRRSSSVWPMAILPRDVLDSFVAASREFCAADSRALSCAALSAVTNRPLPSAAMHCRAASSVRKPTVLIVTSGRSEWMRFAVEHGSGAQVGSPSEIRMIDAGPLAGRTACSNPGRGRGLARRSWRRRFAALGRRWCSSSPTRRGRRRSARVESESAFGPALVAVPSVVHPARSSARTVHRTSAVDWLFIGRKLAA